MSIAILRIQPLYCSRSKNIPETSIHHQLFACQNCSIWLLMHIFVIGLLFPGLFARLVLWLPQLSCFWTLFSNNLMSNSNFPPFSVLPRLVIWAIRQEIWIWFYLELGSIILNNSEFNHNLFIMDEISNKTLCAKVLQLNIIMFGNLISTSFNDESWVKDTSLTCKKINKINLNIWIIGMATFKCSHFGVFN